MTLYEFNQAGYNSLPKMAKSAVEKQRLAIVNWLKEDILPEYNDDQSAYFMLLNNDLHYYTIFVWSEGSADVLANEVFSIVKDLGTIKSIEYNDNGSWEFWVTRPDATTHAYYLFDYTGGVIEV